MTYPTDEQVEAAQAALSEFAVLSGRVTETQVRAALTAAAKVRGGVVRALEWEPHGSDWSADTPIWGERSGYYVGKQDGQWYAVVDIPPVIGREQDLGEFGPDGVEAAKAACQADFAHRISECLTAPVLDRKVVTQAVQRAYTAGWNAAMGSPDNDFSADGGADTILASAMTREQVKREMLERLVADAENRSQDAAKDRRHTEAEMWKGRADWLFSKIGEG